MEYVGVILGNDLGYDPEEKSIVVRRGHLKDRGARSARLRKGQVDLLDRIVGKYIRH